MDNTEIESEKVGEMVLGEDTPQAAAKRVVIESFKPVEVKSKDKIIGRKLEISVRHPDFKEPLKMSSAKFQQGDKLVTAGLWLKDDNTIGYRTALGAILKILKKTKLKDIAGEQIETTIDENGYLIFRAY